jgi:hypothetical protein
MSVYLSQYVWEDLLTVNFTADDLWNSFRNVLNEGIDLFVPYKYVRSNNASGPGRRRRCPKAMWRIKNKKLSLYKAHRSNPSNTNIRAKYKQECAKYKRAVREDEIEREKKILDANNVGSFYKYVNSKLKCHSGVGTLIDSNGNDVVDDRRKANLLNDYFCSVGTIDNGINPPIRNSSNVLIDNIHFDELKVIKAAKKIRTKHKNTCDHEGYPILLLTKLISVLSIPLSLIFNSFMSIGKLPNSWKTAIVTPIFKNGLSSNPANYRPISRTSIFCKLMERIIAADLRDFLTSNNLLCDSQHGFTVGKSTLTNLLETTSDLTYAMDKSVPQTIIYIDFKKAFDSVSHPKLIHKLKSFGVSGDLLLLISDFLSDRSQATHVGHDTSSTRDINSGVIQGSCLGPLLFLTFINDLPQIFDPSLTVKIFADDLKVYLCVQSLVDEFLLQNALNKLQKWADQWQLTISIHKCSVLHIIPSRSESTKKPFYFLGLHPLSAQKTVRDLGVLIDEHLSFRPHINTIVSKASSRSYLIFKCFLSNDLDNLLKAFLVYVRPLLEYGSPIWSPHIKKDISAVERVQRRFTKRLPGMFYLTYPERLNKLEIDSLEMRRLKQDLILAYKIYFGKTKSTLTLLPNLINSTRGHDHKLRLPMSHTDHSKYFFTSRVVSVWNSLKNADFASQESFENALIHNLLVHYVTLHY